MLCLKKLEECPKVRETVLRRILFEGGGRVQEDKFSERRGGFEENDCVSKVDASQKYLLVRGADMKRIIHRCP